MPKKSGGKSGRQHHYTQPAPRRARALEVTPVTETVKPSGQAIEIEPIATPTPRPITSARVRPSARPTRSGSRAPLITDYSYVGADLKRIAILAVGAFAIIGGLTFVIH